MRGIEQLYASDSRHRHGLTRQKLGKAGALIAMSLGASVVVMAAALLLWMALHPATLRLPL